MANSASIKVEIRECFIQSFHRHFGSRPSQGLRFVVCIDGAVIRIDSTSMAAAVNLCPIPAAKNFATFLRVRDRRMPVSAAIVAILSRLRASIG
jgi:hypothetical protein